MTHEVMKTNSLYIISIRMSLSPELCPGPGGLDEGEGEDGEDDDGNELPDHQRRVHLQPAVVLACTPTCNVIFFVQQIFFRE